MKTKAILICSLSEALLSAAHAVTIDTVTIGNPGNPHDLATGGLYGAVQQLAAQWAVEHGEPDGGDDGDGSVCAQWGDLGRWDQQGRWVAVLDSE